jgi:hypothetical protein
VWLVEYHADQQSISASGDFWQTRILRPHFTQLYPPEKGTAKTLLEIRYPANLEGIPLLGLLQQNDPRIVRLRSSDLHFPKLFEQIEHGQANKANTEDASDFLRAVLPLIAGNARFFEGTLSENGSLRWVVPPEETFDPKQQRAEDKNRPPEAPTLRRKPAP